MTSATPGQKRVLCVVGTRPEAIKMAPVIAALRQVPWAKPVVVATGQHREMTRQTLEIFGIGVDVDLDVMEPDQTLAGLTSRLIERSDPLLAAHSPDLVLAQGDTTSVMAFALTSFYRRIPFGHVEAGLRTGDLRFPFPEELNRILADRIANIHFVPTDMARRNLLAEQVDSGTIHVTGNTVIDALFDMARRDLPCSYPAIPGNRLVLLTAHRRESFGKPMADMCRAVALLCARYPDVEFVYPIHPNPSVRAVVEPVLAGLDRVHLLDPVDYPTFTALMKRCDLVLTDSGGIQEEAPALKKPTLVLRNESERKEAVEAGVVRVIGTDTQRIVAEVSLLLDDPEHYRRMARGVSPYGDGHAAERIVGHCATLLGVA